MTLKLDQISQIVGGQMHLHALDMVLVPNAVTVLLGATQAGKTSLMRLMAGLDQPTQGGCGSMAKILPVCRCAIAMSPWSTNSSSITLP